MKQKRNTFKHTCLDLSTDKRVGLLKCYIPSRCLPRYSSFFLSFPSSLSIQKFINLFIPMQHFANYYGKIVCLSIQAKVIK